MMDLGALIGAGFVGLASGDFGGGPGAPIHDDVNTVVEQSRGQRHGLRRSARNFLRQI